ncbi:MAG: acyltransferase domain-containing protein, partial [Myxococcota bacterium]
VAGRVANRLNLGGTNCVVDAACASSLSALHLSCLELATGEADLLLTGGVDTFNDIFMYMCFSKTPALSPSGDAKPFDAQGDGTILGEGVGVVALKRLSDAERDNDRIYAVIRGLGSSSDGRGQAIYAPNASGQAKAIQRAYHKAQCDPQDITLLEAHGTGTAVGDATEVKGLLHVFQNSSEHRSTPSIASVSSDAITQDVVQSEATTQDADQHTLSPWCALGSVKSQIGHTKAAAGIASLIKVALALHRKVLPPTIKVEQPLPLLQEQKVFYLPKHKKPWFHEPSQPRKAALSAFGFGGSNFHCVLEEHEHTAQTPDWDGQLEVVPLCAPTLAQLAEQIEHYKTLSSWEALAVQAWQDRQKWDAKAEYRLLACLERNDSLHRSLQAFDTFFRNLPADATQAYDPRGFAFGHGTQPLQTAIVFPGQGSQYPEMLNDLICHFPKAMQILEHAEQCVLKHNQTSMLRTLFPRPAWSAEQAQQQRTALAQTQIAQPALGAVQLAAHRILEDFGVQAQMFAGHSYGEWSALHAAGSISFEQFMAFSCLRGKLMAESDQGSMLALQHPQENIVQWLEEHQLALVVANHNSPQQIVLSGATESIERAHALLQKQGLRSIPLNVSAAFHSPLMKSAEQAFAKALRKLQWQPTDATVFANTTAQPYPKDAKSCRKLLAQHLTQPVRFVEQIEAMIAQGANLFIEVGPGQILSTLIRQITQPHSHVSVTTLDPSKGKSPGLSDFARLLIQLSAKGQPIAWQKWQDIPTTLPPKSKINITLSGANLFTPPPAPLKTFAPSKRIKPRKTIVEQQSTFAKVSKPLQSAQNANIRSVAHLSEQNPAMLHSLSATNHPSKPIPQKCSRPNTVRSNTTYQTSNTATQRPSVARPKGEDLMSSSQPFTQHLMLQLLELQKQTTHAHQRFLEGQQHTRQLFTQLMHPSMLSTAIPHSPTYTTIDPSTPTTQTTNAIPQTQPMEQAAHSAQPPIQTPTSIPAFFNNTAPMTHSNPSIPAISYTPSAQPTPMQQPIPVAGEGFTPRPPQLHVRPPIVPTSTHFTNVTAPEAPNITPTPAIAIPAPNAVPTPAPVSNTDLKTRFFAIISEKTGYPTEILEPSMELDADLGIDSIKRVEILSTLQEQVSSLPHLSSQTLGELRTLQDILELLSGPVPTSTQGQPPRSEDALRPQLFAVIAEKTGYPAEILEPSMELDADLGIDSIKRVEILSTLQEQVPSLPHLSSQTLGELQTLQDILDILEASSPSQNAIPEAQKNSANTEDPSKGVN